MEFFSLEDPDERLRVEPAHLQQSYRDKFTRIPSPLDVDIDSLNTFHLFDVTPVGIVMLVAGMAFAAHCTERSDCPVARLAAL